MPGYLESLKQARGHWLKVPPGDRNKQSSRTHQESKDEPDFVNEPDFNIGKRVSVDGKQKILSARQ